MIVLSGFVWSVFIKFRLEKIPKLQYKLMDLKEIFESEFLNSFCSVFFQSTKMNQAFNGSISQ